MTKMLPCSVIRQNKFGLSVPDRAEPQKLILRSVECCSQCGPESSAQCSGTARGFLGGLGTITHGQEGKILVA